MVGNGPSDCVIKLLARKTGYTMIGKLSDRTMHVTSRRTKMLLRRAPRRFKTITSDNGTEGDAPEAVEGA